MPRPPDEVLVARAGATATSPSPTATSARIAVHSSHHQSPRTGRSGYHGAGLGGASRREQRQRVRVGEQRGRARVGRGEVVDELDEPALEPADAEQPAEAHQVRVPAPWAVIAAYTPSTTAAASSGRPLMRAWTLVKTVDHARVTGSWPCGARQRGGGVVRRGAQVVAWVACRKRAWCPIVRKPGEPASWPPRERARPVGSSRPTAWG